eukprot:Phypoly_transcript_12437.p3 GENE.Phypoly_transcript_12437~~Phypoly_transcript_12437.p3  ORF type:complete len:114 (-),score=19.39 Phypoly_transcript_12437:583-924(-)
MEQTEANEQLQAMLINLHQTMELCNTLSNSQERRFVDVVREMEDNFFVSRAALIARKIALLIHLENLQRATIEGSAAMGIGLPQHLLHTIANHGPVEAEEAPLDFQQAQQRSE